MELDLIVGKAKEKGVVFDTKQHSFSFWANWSQNYNFNIYLNYYYDYNYNREFYANMLSGGAYFSYVPDPRIRLETDYSSWIEFNPNNSILEITHNFRPKVTYAITKDIHFRIYVDNTILKSSGKLERMLIGGLFSYNFSPKSWLYLAYNDNYEMKEPSVFITNPTRELKSLDKIVVFKVRYLYYF
jgi:hypothetical protein